MGGGGVPKPRDVQNLYWLVLRAWTHRYDLNAFLYLFPNNLASNPATLPAVLMPKKILAGFDYNEEEYTPLGEKEYLDVGE